MSKLQHLLLKSFILVGVLWGIFPGREAYMQAGVTWSLPLNVSQSPGKSTDPAIVADQTGLVHLFWSEEIGGTSGGALERQYGNTIAYSRWNGSAWSDPIDILVSPDGGTVWQPVAAVDSTGMLHLIWASEFGVLYYSHAHVNEAGTARGWLAPVELTTGLPTLALPAALGVDSQGIVHVIYTSREPGGEVMHVASLDGGLTWAWDKDISISVQALFPVVEGTLVSGGTALTIDEADVLHVGWSMFNADGFGVAVFYTNSRDGGLTWSEPLIVGEKGPDDYEADWLNIATVGTDTIMLVWTGIGHPPGRIYRYSLDGGQTWTPPTPFMEGLVGETESPRMVVDSAATIHLLTPARRDRGDRSSGTRYLTWVDGIWSEPYLIPGPEGKESRYGSLRHTATIRLGNELFDAWYDEGLGDIWVIQGFLDIPALAPLPFTERDNAWMDEPEQIVPSPQPATSTTMSSVEFDSTMPSLREDGGSLYAVAVGIIPALIVVLWVFFAQTRRKHTI